MRADLYIQWYQLSYRTFELPEKVPFHPSVVNPFLPPQVCESTALLSVTVISTFFDVHIKGIVQYVVYYMSSFIKNNVFKNQPCSCMYQKLILFYCWVVFSYIIPKYVYPFVSWWKYELFLVNSIIFSSLDTHVKFILKFSSLI